jgi:hypothetical protein
VLTDRRRVFANQRFHVNPKDTNVYTLQTPIDQSNHTITTSEYEVVASENRILRYYSSQILQICEEVITPQRTWRLGVRSNTCILTHQLY